MNIDICLYRRRIGCFSQNIYRKGSKVSHMYHHQHHYSQFRLFFALSVFMFIAVLSFTNINEHQSSSYLKLNLNYKLSRLRNLGYWTNVNFLARYKFGNKNKGGLKIMHWNAGGGYLKNKINEIETVIATYKPHVLGISESCFMEEHDRNEIEIENYDVFLSRTLENPNLMASRLAVYVLKDVPRKILRSDLMEDNFSSIWLEIGLRKQKSILVGNVYREWQYINQGDKSSHTVNAQYERFLNFIDKWETALRTCSECHLVGDMNLNFLEYNRPNVSVNSQSYKLRQLIDLLTQRILPLGAVQCINSPTRISPDGVESCLDHYYTTEPQKLSNIQTITNGASDHKMVLAVRSSMRVVNSERVTKKRSYKHFDPTNFIEAVRKVSWWKVYSCNDPQNAVDLLTMELTSILDTMAPIKVVQNRKNFAPWLSTYTKEIIKMRNEALDKAHISNNEGDWCRYKKLQNKVTNLLKNEKLIWQERKLKEASTDSRKIWSFAKSWLGWSKGGPPKKLLVGDRLVSKPYEIAQHMNSFFKQKVQKIVENLPNDNQDVLELPRKIMQNRNCTFSLKAAHPDEIDKVIAQLKPSKSSGLDNVDAYIIKLARSELVPVITHIVNLSIIQFTFPSSWKVAKVIPLHKSGDEMNPKNFRPVALLPVLSKILERIVFQQIVKYMEANDLFHPSHHGFRHGLSTTSALLEMNDVWLEAFDNKKITAIVMIDLSAAFDVVNPSILLQKLRIYGFNEDSIQWLRSYLNSRYQKVYIDGFLSEAIQVDIGVPQGSIIGPLMYTLYTNDLPEAVHEHQPITVNEELSPTLYNFHCTQCGGICCFADDSTFSISRNNADDLREAINKKYKDIASYMSSNRLALNNDKTKLLVMTSSQQHRKYDNFGVNLNTGSEIIQPSECERLLGVKISNNFTWNGHIVAGDKAMMKSLTLRNNGLRKICRSADFKTRKMFANGLVNSCLIYAIQVYGTATDYLLNHLQVQQNEAARLVTRLGRRTETSELLKQVGWMSVRQMFVYHTLLMVFKILRTGKPSHFRRMFRQSYSYQTRQFTSHCLAQLETPKTELFRNSLRHNGVQLWNSLPTSIRNMKKLEEFKLNLKRWIPDNIQIN